MQEIIRLRETQVWLLLAALTGLSWWLAAGDDVTAIGLILLAFFKTRLVLLHFMELRTAPMPLRAMFEAWVMVICAIVIGLYLYS